MLARVAFAGLLLAPLAAAPPAAAGYKTIVNATTETLLVTITPRSGDSCSTNGKNVSVRVGPSSIAPLPYPTAAINAVVIKSVSRAKGATTVLALICDKLGKAPTLDALLNGNAQFVISPAGYGYGFDARN